MYRAVAQLLNRFKNAGGMSEILLGGVFPYSNSLDTKEEGLKRILPLGA